LYIFNNMNE